MRQVFAQLGKRKAKFTISRKKFIGENISHLYLKTYNFGQKLIKLKKVMTVLEVVATAAFSLSLVS